MNFITAQEAKKKTDEINDTELNELLVEILDDINSCIEHGKYDLIYYTKDKDKLKTKEYLKSFGYTVEVFDDYQGFSMKISWEKI